MGYIGIMEKKMEAIGAIWSGVLHINQNSTYGLHLLINGLGLLSGPLSAEMCAALGKFQTLKVKPLNLPKPPQSRQTNGLKSAKTAQTAFLVHTLKVQVVPRTNCIWPSAQIAFVDLLIDRLYLSPRKGGIIWMEKV